MNCCFRQSRRFPIFLAPRFYSSTSNATIRQSLLSELKTAMKEKNTLTSTTIRAVLSEIYLADKAVAPEIVQDPSVIGILKKATSRRNESAKQFVEAGRPELAQKEEQEVQILSKFLPPLLQEEEIDRCLKEAIATLPSGQADPRKRLGEVYKAFYSKVDKNLVDPEVVKRRALQLLGSSQ